MMVSGYRRHRVRKELLRSSRDDSSEIFRRYFINTLFDSTFVVLGILAASAFIPEGNPRVALGAIFAACLAIGISTGVSVYEAEHTETEIRLSRLERAMLAPLSDTEIGRGMVARRMLTSLVNFSAPLLVAGITSTPILLFDIGVIPSFGTAALLSSGLGLAIVFAAGFYLGRLTPRSPWLKAIRMTLVALLTFAVLVALERFL